jgi:RNA polymerase sigma factor (sigma-70 family)
MPPPAEGFAARLGLGPALRAQPDRRLVSLVRDGYEATFEEIVRRYGKSLTRYAGAIVGAQGEDVAQDAFAKALLALRRDGADVELRPWLFRIVRNTALNELRDRPASAEALAEEIAGGSSPSQVLERREELADLMRRLQALPDAQRAAIVMREMEGLSHDEIAAALGLSDGAARQAIFRARRALRDGAGMLLPLPLLKALLAGAATTQIEAAAGTAGLGGAAGAGLALKAATATVLVAGAVGAGVAIDHSHEGTRPGDRPGTHRIAAERSRSDASLAALPETSGETGGQSQSDPHRGNTSREGAESEGGGGSDSGGPHGGEGGDGSRHGGHRGEGDNQPAVGEDRGGGDPSKQGGSDTDGRSGPATSGSSASGDDGGTGGGSEELSDSGSSGDGSGSGGGSDSNSGPGSGEDGGSDNETPSGDSRSGDSGDLGGDDGLSHQTQSQTQEEP